jgi:hypothetical protein
MSSQNLHPAPVSVERQVTTVDPVPEAARVLAAVTVPHLSPRGHTHLHLLLGAKRAFPGPAGTRRRWLCVILDFMHAHGRRPKLPEFLEENERRTAAGEDVPSLKQLYKRFGSYPKAVALAARYFDGGTGARTPSRAPTQRPRGSVTEKMLLDSVEALFDELGDWPDDADYAAILNAEVLLRAKLGVGDVELYSNTAFNDTFGSYGEGLQAAKRRYAERARLREERAASPPTPTPGNPRPARRRTRSSNLRAPG